MSLLQSLLHLTNFKSPLLRTLVPAVSAAYAIQAAFALPSILAQNERFYDFSGSLTYLSVTALSLYLPALRAKYTPTLANASISMPSLLAPFTSPGGVGTLNWRQVVLSGAVIFWAVRLGSYLFQRILEEGKDSRFDEIKKSPARFAGAFFAQATWVSLCLMPVIALNAVPASAFAALPAVKASDALGLLVYVAGFAFEITADRQKSKWLRERREKAHDQQFMTSGLWSVSQYPNYFGEISLWTGIATAAAGTLVSQPIQVALGLSGGVAGLFTAAALSYVSPAFVSFLLLKVSGVPMSEKKYDKRYGDRKDYQEWKKITPKLFPKIL
ncbi:Putative 3-oxo-5-alpha-steroid 4-dehydrogenase, probable O-methyltransferase UstE [Colletotrichum destructivum]|uniref:3-oxo-5-alpha-steroid 4-dehydrogenase, probable O-methyltransferase UstE n=1 Tax=Colletotrichum destructivum TaxID=34406 RepID=A0AAX4ISH4_9PEZI|nr:Putative 3-oxo-5-alpha-steroid 4-dehydrogenase, probable O-methyltransferase UstE [Colletotrichum destructivum]